MPARCVCIAAAGVLGNYGLGKRLVAAVMVLHICYAALVSLLRPYNHKLVGGAAGVPLVCCWGVACVPLGL